MRKRYFGAYNLYALYENNHKSKWYIIDKSSKIKHTLFKLIEFISLSLLDIEC